MNLTRIILTVVLILCAGCETIVIRPASAPICPEIPTELTNACQESATLKDSLMYGELPEVILNTRKDFIECRKTYNKVIDSYNICVSGLKNFNQSLKNLEDRMKDKYKDATFIQQN